MSMKKLSLSAVAVLLLGAACLVAYPDILRSQETRHIVMPASKDIARAKPLMIGVGVHFGIGGQRSYKPEESAEAIRRIGFDYYRDDLPWVDFRENRQLLRDKISDPLYRFMSLKAARPLIVMGYSNPRVPEANPPLTDNGRRAFSAFMANAAKAIQPLDPIYEVWNEWNINAVQGRDFLRGPGDESDPRAAVHYARLAKMASKAIADAVPGATILVGSVGIDRGWKWTEAILDMGVLEYASGLSVHVYNQCERSLSDRTAAQMFGQLDALQALLRSRNGGKDYPVYLTEVGWPTAGKDCAVDEKDTANYSAQILLWSAATPWLAGTWIYELRDQDRKSDSLEAHFGITRDDFSPKPATCMVTEAIKLIRSAKAMSMEKPMDDVFLLRLATAGGIKLVAWTGYSATKARLTVNGAQPDAVTPLCDGPDPWREGGVELSPLPAVVSFKSDGDLDLTIVSNP